MIFLNFLLIGDKMNRVYCCFGIFHDNRFIRYPAAIHLSGISRFVGLFWWCVALAWEGVTTHYFFLNHAIYISSFLINIPDPVSSKTMSLFIIPYLSAISLGKTKVALDGPLFQLRPIFLLDNTYFKVYLLNKVCVNIVFFTKRCHKLPYN